MAKASIVKELLVKAENKLGMMAEVAGAIADSGANITALNAFGIGKDAMFRIITSDNYIYGSTCDCGRPSTIIFNCNNNEKAVEVLGG